MILYPAYILKKGYISRILYLLIYILDKSVIRQGHNSGFSWDHDTMPCLLLRSSTHKVIIYTFFKLMFFTGSQYHALSPTQIFSTHSHPLYIFQTQVFQGITIPCPVSYSDLQHTQSSHLHFSNSGFSWDHDTMPCLLLRSSAHTHSACKLGVRWSKGIFEVDKCCHFPKCKNSFIFTRKKGFLVKIS